MLLAYLDESYTDTRYYMGAVVVPDRAVKSLTAALDEIVGRAAARYEGIGGQTELHAHELVAGKKAWKPLHPLLRVRIQIYHDAVQAIADHDVDVLVRGVDIPRLNARYTQPDHPHSIVLGHLIERINDLATDRGEWALMIADEIDQQDTYRQDLWHCQKNGTWGYRARPIDRIVDTIHFAPSNVSRLLQAADLVTYLCRRRHAHTETNEKSEREWAALWARIMPSVTHLRCWMP